MTNPNPSSRALVSVHRVVLGGLITQVRADERSEGVLWPRHPDWERCLLSAKGFLPRSGSFLLFSHSSPTLVTVSAGVYATNHAFVGSICRNVGSFWFLDGHRFTWSTFSWWGRCEGGSSVSAVPSLGLQALREPLSAFIASCEHLLPKPVSDCTVSCFRCCQNPSSALHMQSLSNMPQCAFPPMFVAGNTYPFWGPYLGT